MKTTFRILIIALVLWSCQPRETEVVILSLNDLHAKIDNLDKVAAYVNDVREQHPNVLLLSAGDLFSGNPVVDYHPEKGFPIVDILNDMQFDALTLGNHEFDYGLETLAKRINQSHSRFICANIYTDSSPLPKLRPYLCLTKGGERICIVGLTQERPEAHEDKIRSLSFSNPMEEFAKYLPMHKQSSIFIALTHMGAVEDSLLASRYRKIDLIIGGHSHTKLDTGIRVNGALITQAEKYVRYIGQTTVKLKNGKIVSKRNELIDVAQLTKRDTAITRKIEQYNKAPELQQVIGTLRKPIAGSFNIGNFFCDAVRAQTKSDVVFQNIGGVRLDALSKGALTKKDLYLADPFGNEVVQFEMSGDEILQFITNVYSRFQQLDLCVSGISYKVFLKNNQITAQAFLPNGKAINRHKKYSVAMNSYMSTKTDDYQRADSAKGKGLKITTAEAAEQYIKLQKTISYAAARRAVVVVGK